jgi:raffinose/stachyose/melibiose transport system permease protein
MGLFRTGNRTDRYGNWRDLLYLLPALALVMPFKFVPLINGLADSLRHWVGVGDVGQFVGLDNYAKMVSDPAVVESFANVGRVVLTLPIWVVSPLLVAYLIHQRTPGWRLFRAVYFLPYMIAPVIVGSIFREILGTSGPLNLILQTVGLGSLAQAWLGGTNTALLAVVGVALWSFFGLGVITYLAGLASLDDAVLEAAAIDGAGFWRTLLNVVLPMLRPVVGYWAVLCLGGMFIWMFPLLFSLTQGGPGYATMLPEYLVYLTAFQFNDRGYATAIGIVLFGVASLASFWIVREMYATSVAREGS